MAEVVVAPATEPTGDSSGAVEDSRSIDDLVRALSPGLKRIASRICVDDHEANDVVQHAWLTYIERRHTIRDESATEAWLRACVRNEAFRRIRDRRRFVGEAALPTQSAPGADELTERRESAAMLSAALNELSPKYRTVIAATVLDGRQYDDVSCRYGIPIGSIGPTRQRGLDRLRASAALAGL